MSDGRGRILDAAWGHYARRGTLDATGIAQEAQTSKALLFHHFGNVDGLRDAMAERVLRETQRGLDAIADDNRSPRERLDALVRALLAEPPETPAIARNVLAFWLTPDAGGAPRGALRDALLGDFVAKTLKEMRSNAEARGVASMLLARWHGATVVYASGGFVDFEAEAERALAEIQEMLQRRAQP